MELYPYLLRDLTIAKPNQVWATDITYIPMAHGFVYLIALLDWFSRRVLSWRLSITMEVDFCLEAVEDALIGWVNRRFSIRICQAASKNRPGSASKSRPVVPHYELYFAGR